MILKMCGEDITIAATSTAKCRKKSCGLPNYRTTAAVETCTGKLFCFAGSSVFTSDSSEVGSALKL
jgi:hypothetical protein